MALLDDTGELPDRPTAEPAAYPIVHRIPQDGGHQEDDAGDPHIDAGCGIGCDRPHREQERIAGQERRHHQSRFAKDDEEEQSVNQDTVMPGEIMQVILQVEHQIEEIFENLHGGESCRLGRGRSALVFFAHDHRGDDPGGEDGEDDSQHGKVEGIAQPDLEPFRGQHFHADQH